MNMYMEFLRSKKTLTDQEEIRTYVEGHGTDYNFPVKAVHVYKIGTFDGYIDEWYDGTFNLHIANREYEEPLYELELILFKWMQDEN